MELFKSLTVHEKKFGERISIESVIVSKRRHQYEEVDFLLLFGRYGKPNLASKRKPLQLRRLVRLHPPADQREHRSTWGWRLFWARNCQCASIYGLLSKQSISIIILQFPIGKTLLAPLHLALGLLRDLWGVGCAGYGKVSWSVEGLFGHHSAQAIHLCVRLAVVC